MRKQFVSSMFVCLVFASLVLFIDALDALAFRKMTSIFLAAINRLLSSHLAASSFSLPVTTSKLELLLFFFKGPVFRAR